LKILVSLIVLEYIVVRNGAIIAVVAVAGIGIGLFVVSRKSENS